MEIETKYKMELLGMVTALGYAHEKETHDKRTETRACDLIDRQAAVDALEREKSLVERPITETRWFDFGLRKAQDVLSELPSVQPEVKPIEYRDCANAMLRMWMDNVVTDWEYNRIMGKLNAHWRM